MPNPVYPAQLLATDYFVSSRAGPAKV